ncbi:MAG: hypothetical protein P1S60_15930 [Anaerolineae bacterium]|nr:hypothetical protein [Anaerolineae bacterium]
MFKSIKKGVLVGLVVSLAVLAVPLTVAARGGQPPAQAPRTLAGEAVNAGSGLPGAQRGGWMTGGVSMVDAVAEAAGMPVEDVIAALQNGTSISDLADPNAVIAVLTEVRSEALAQAVADGRLTQETADTMLAQMQEDWQEKLSNPWTAQGPGYGSDFDGSQPSDGSGYRGGRNAVNRGTGRTDRPMTGIQDCPLATQ